MTAAVSQTRGAIAAVEAAVRAMEDNPRFNAGRGSALTTDGTVEMDASIMEGDRLRNGAVASVSGVRNPVTLARRILEDGHHSLFVGPGAAARARALGVALCDPEDLITEHQRRRLAAVQAGTVGAVALDRFGTIAAAPSTGGTAGKLPGRVGDSALIGCGTYAESTLGGVSCTGDGEGNQRDAKQSKQREEYQATHRSPPSEPRTSVSSAGDLRD